MIVFGITGSIATGKSNISKVFKSNDIQIIDADLISRKLIEPGQKALSDLINCFGTKYLQPFNRPAFSNFIFNTEGALSQLNQIMFPHIKNEVSKQIEQHHKFGQKIVGYDCALIIEMNDINKYYPLIVASCSKENQIKRLIKRYSCTEQEAFIKMNAQLSTEQKIKYADYVIDTNSSKEETTKQVELIIKHLRTLRRT